MSCGAEADMAVYKILGYVPVPVGKAKPVSGAQSYFFVNVIHPDGKVTWLGGSRNVRRPNHYIDDVSMEFLLHLHDVIPQTCKQSAKPTHTLSEELGGLFL